MRSIPRFVSICADEKGLQFTHLSFFLPGFFALNWATLNHGQWSSDGEEIQQAALHCIAWFHTPAGLVSLYLSELHSNVISCIPVALPCIEFSQISYNVLPHSCDGLSVYAAVLCFLCACIASHCTALHFATVHLFSLYWIGLHSAQKRRCINGLHCILVHFSAPRSWHGSA